MKKYTLLALSFLLIPSISFAQGRDNAIQQITKQRDIADYNCKNNQPNPGAAIGYCKKRDGLQRKLDNMNNGSNYSNNNNRYNNHNNRNHNHYNNRNNHQHYNHNNHHH